jgi:FtsZ-interacting cell division protein ZipA
MPQLRLTLLIVGLVFLAGLAWWELRRSRQARGSDLQRPAPEAPDWAPSPMSRSRESDRDLELPRMSARDPEADLPVVEFEPADFAALEARAEAAVTPPETDDMEGLLDELGASQVPDPPISDIAESAEPAPASVPASEADPELAAQPAVEAEPVAEPEDAIVTESVAAPVSVAEPEPETAPTPLVDWPAVDASQVIAVRLVSAGERFSGRAVRQALAADGFVLGKFSIFHKPAPDGRALLSIASLTKPGTFDAHSIDMQRYSGLNLFTVLPGPLPGPDAVNELLASAQLLCQRLRGALQDEHGEPLTPSRTATMRSSAATQI